MLTVLPKEFSNPAFFFLKCKFCYYESTATVERETPVPLSRHMSVKDRFEESALSGEAAALCGRYHTREGS